MEKSTSRPAVVYLLTHRTHDLSKLVSISGYLFNVSDIQAEDRGKHWALIVHFEDDIDHVFLCELERFDANFKVYTVCERMSLETVKTTRLIRRIYKLGSTTISEDELSSLVKTNEINEERYNLISRNCQHWAQLLCKDLNIPSMFEMNEERSTPDDPVMNYELEVGNHLGLESEESKSRKYVSKARCIIDKMVDKLNNDSSLELDDEQKHKIGTYIEQNSEPNDLERTDSQEKILTNMVNVLQNESKKCSIVDQGKKLVTDFFSHHLGSKMNQKAIEGSSSPLSLSPESTKRIFQSFAGVILNKSTLENK